MLTFYWYPKCGTCRNAKRWLDENDVDYKAVNLVETPPSKEMLLQMMKNSDLPSKRFFNSSGKKYRELGLKDKVGDMTLEEQAEILASDGMLIKRPLATDGSRVTAGFKEAEYEANWL
ncbi:MULTISPECIES: arsenate reductase family protein [Salimicrobium]|uniref:Arsenate reductase n=2 Tax=Salimicrobium TaxID=351195 RepID=A0ABY1KSF0_9BACI|nr:MULTISPECIES: arsenate reductase family protein [Salimicrobium]SDY00171.1 arsenate reductase [Salimicrobium album]SIS71478.1 arsenate reductase [Salimicrobium salexigens]